MLFSKFLKLFLGECSSVDNHGSSIPDKTLVSNAVKHVLQNISRDFTLPPTGMMSERLATMSLRFLQLKHLLNNLKFMAFESLSLE